ncbi:hypothetical protein OROGR_031469 [Orobanche gracilis]
MSRKPYHISIFLLLLSSLLQSILTVQYKVVNTVPDSPGGSRFNSKIGVRFTPKTMRDINTFIWKTFKQYSDTQRKQVPVLTVNITDLEDGALGETGGENIYIRSTGIQYFPRGEANRAEALTEGVADYIMVKSNYYDPSSYTKPGEGNTWDEGYGVTARFLEYCDSLREGFTAELNNKMREVYKDEYFEDLLGKSLARVWSDYKAKYGN